MPEINGIECAELEDPLSQGATLREITLQYQPTYSQHIIEEVDPATGKTEEHYMTDEEALAETLSVNTPHGADDPVEADQTVYLTPAVYNT